jgi:cell division protease FtsH
MDKLADHLIEKETITGKEFMEIYRKEKGLPEPEEEKAEVAATEEKVNVEPVAEETETEAVSGEVTDAEIVAEEKCTSNNYCSPGIPRWMFIQAANSFFCKEKTASSPFWKSL